MSIQLNARCLIITTLIAASASPSAGMDAISLDLEALAQYRIISTPKFADHPDQVPSLVSVLTADDIHLYGWRTLGDALRSLQGFNVTDDHTYTYASVRGISQAGDYRARMQLLIDGIAVNDNIFGSAATGSDFPLDIGLIERIEIIRGPSASVYGSDSMFGVINVITRNAQTLNGGEAAIGIGSGKSYRLRASTGGSFAAGDYLVSFTGFDSSGRGLVLNDVNANGESQRVHGVGADQGGQLFVRARGADWRATLIHGQRDRTVTNASYATIPDDKGHVESDRYTLFDLGKDWELNAKAALHQRLYYSATGYDGKFPFDYSADGGPSRLFNIDKARGNAWGFENRLISNAWDRQRWTVGLEYRANIRQDQLNYDRAYGCYDPASAASTGTSCLNDRRQSHVATAYLQDEISLTPADTLILGLRRDRVSDSKNFWSPRLGLIHDAGDAGLFKLLYGTAFRNPSPYERTYITPTLRYGNPNLGPERMKSLELTWEKNFTPLAKLSITTYTMQVDALVTVNPDTGIVANGKQINARGLEMGYDQRWNNGVKIRGGISTQYAAAQDTGRLDNSPRHMVKLNIGLPAGIPGLRLGIESQWVDQRFANSGSEKIKSYLLTNLNLAYAPAAKHWELGFGIYNLFDHRYADPVSVDEPASGITRWSLPQLGRNVQLRTLFRF